MASLKSIKKRIGSVKNTQKITKAMKMVAAAKLRRAQVAAFNARPYTHEVIALTNRLIVSQQNEKHPLTIASDKISKREYLVFTSDRGLCGGFNSNLLRRLGDMLLEGRSKNIQSDCRIIGKKGRDYFKSKAWEIAESVTGLYDNLNRKVAKDLATIATHRFEEGKTDEVWIVFNYFRSAMVQEVTFKKILPIETSEKTKKAIDYIYEPNAQVLVDALLRERVVSEIYQAFLESMASELASRMAAMENATSNASDMIRYLTLVYNRVRQAAITRDLMDIVNGAEALR
ncbi:MAG: ATP synthase F1 subunit gamma [Deltaproteobacteria bacterium]|nr:ATP synthase F1 subunit gamma [Deltaproteobacteria bacterium]